LCLLAFGNDQTKRIIFVVLNDLLVLEQLEKAAVGNFLDVRVTVAANEEGEAEQTDGERNADNAAPIKARLGVAFVISIRIFLGHRGSGFRLT
jgi:hypothetical protein